MNYHDIEGKNKDDEYNTTKFNKKADADASRFTNAYAYASQFTDEPAPGLPPTRLVGWSKVSVETIVNVLNAEVILHMTMFIFLFAELCLVVLTSFINNFE